MLDERPVETTLYSLGGDAPCPLKRRHDERHVSLLRVGSLILADRRELCLIRNVSAGGMMIRIYSDIAAGTRLSVELKQGEQISGYVRWIKYDFAGVTFDAPIDIVDLISAAGDGPRPRIPRVEVNCTAWVREDGTVHRMTGANISQGGMMVVGAANLTVNASVVITLIDLPPAQGIVRWKDGAAHGIHFTRPLGLPMLVSWLRGQQDNRRAAS
ncbi:PilZ domain-containing protein [Sphingomonas lutea]|uniref:PilZ domain-containing protein n=2 Tax=Sphingomonas lutea TaxID=1045317 RepID=A0A7G9SET6_9SPHN|nr:PilZ domain-containing protein [Sphingomonas lutea]QNN66361.1 PilZ domain-containing protein [Sphingomonas lutea]